MEVCGFVWIFNTGLGMVMIVAEEKAEEAAQELRNAGEKVWQVRRIIERTGTGEDCVVERMDVWR